MFNTRCRPPPSSTAHGPAATSVRQIAKEAGVDHGLSIATSA